MLSCKGLVMRFGGVRAIDGVDFVLQAGGVHCIVGPNGAGKSTFFKMVAGQLTPTEGSITLNGDDITGMPSHRIVRKGVGIKTQTPQLYEELSARENIWLGAQRKFGANHAVARAEALLEEFSLAASADRAVGQLSHGVRQRVEIASVLAADPALILLDEPAAGMSDVDIDRMTVIIQRLRDRHSFMVVEHDMGFIRRIADRVTVLHQGRIFLEGAADQVLSNQGVKDIYLGKGLATHA